MSKNDLILSNNEYISRADYLKTRNMAYCKVRNTEQALVNAIVSPEEFSIDCFLREVALPLSQIISLLRSSPDKTAHKVVRKYDAVTPERDSLDFYIKQARVPLIKIMLALQVELCRLKIVLSNIIAAQNAEDTMRACADGAKNIEFGFADRRMLLQTVGVVPMPRNSVQNLTLVGNIDARSQQALNFVVPRLEDIVRSLDGPSKILRNEVKAELEASKAE